MNVFVITSPFQVLNAVEAIHHFGFSDNRLVTLQIGLFSRSQYESILGIHEWQGVEYLIMCNAITKRLPLYDFGAKPPANLRERGVELYLTFHQFEKRRRIDRLAESLGEVDNLVLGSYRSDYDLHFRHLANRVNCRNVYVLDVGTNTLDFQRDEGKVAGRRPPLQTGQGGFFKRLKHTIRHRYIDWDDFGAKSVNFFTCYDCDGAAQDRVVKNEYRYLKSLMHGSSPSNGVFFLVESLVNDGFLSFDAYVNTLRRIKEYFYGSDLLYIPHPRESGEYVEAIRDALGFAVKRFDVPIEYGLVIEGKKPKCVASFFSSALLNCSVIFGDSLDVKSFRLREEDFLKGGEMASRIYSHFSSGRSGSMEVIGDY